MRGTIKIIAQVLLTAACLGTGVLPASGAEDQSPAAPELRLSLHDAIEAAIEAARLRFRPIIMTSMAFIGGVAPLVVATGARAAGRYSIGTGVFGGMLAATFLAIFSVPLFFVLVRKLSRRAAPRPAQEGA